MSIIKVENLTFAYPSSHDNIFENASFCIDTDWKTGFIGRNGRGKTTLLRLLLGEFDYKGRILSSTMFDYFPYRVDDKNRLTLDIISEICNAEDWELKRELSLLEVDENVLYREFDTLSSGEQTKVLLAALFLNEGHFLLIDEPTNHLDMHGRATLARYLKTKRGFLLVSHDRRFLDDCVDHILSINKSDIEVQAGNFSSYDENFRRKQWYESKQNERLEKEITALKAASERTAKWSDKIESERYGGGGDRGYIGHQSAKMMKRSKSIEARRNRAIDEKSALLKNKEYEETLKIHPIAYHSDLLVSVKDVSVRYDDRTIFEPVSFEVRQGDRIVLDGKNGSGKSSLIKLILGENIENTGDVRVASGLKISYVPQDTSHLSGSLKDYALECGIDESLFFTILRKMDFKRIQFEKDMSDYSGGQKKKVLIARSLCERANLYIWDEPLNFVDVYSRMQIEGLITEFNPTMILIEHDRAFREAVATAVVEVNRL